MLEKRKTETGNDVRDEKLAVRRGERGDLGRQEKDGRREWVVLCTTLEPRQVNLVDTR